MATPRCSFSLHYGPFLLLVAVGRVTFQDMREMVDMCAAVTRSGRHPRLLIDYTAIDYDLDDLQRHEIGLYAAKSLAHLSMVAVVTHASQFNGVGLRTALDEGMRLRVFHDMREADAWITSAGGAPPR